MEIISSSFIEKFIRYGIVGCIGMVVDFSTTFFFKEFAKVSKYLANSLGFSLAVIVNYILNRFWTFENVSENVLVQFGTFVMVSIIGLFINNFVIYILNEKWNINFYVSKIVAIGVVVVWNFTINYYYTFQSSI